MSDTKCPNTLLLEVMISSKYERVFFRNFSAHTVQIIFDHWWASMNEGYLPLIAWNNSRHVPSCRFDLNYGIEETGSPGNISIICHRVPRHSSDHGTS
jgi:hypothetical protein